MKKLGLLIIGGIAALVLLSTIGPLVGLALCLVILYFVFKQFLKTDSLWLKIALAIFGIFLLMATASNAPAILAIVAAYILYLVYKKWNEEKGMKFDQDDDPFQNFENQWSKINKY